MSFFFSYYSLLRSKPEAYDLKHRKETLCGSFSLTDSFLTMLDLSCQKKLLSTPAERQRRLEVTPEVIPDEEEQSKETESKAAASDPFQGNQGTSS